MSHLIELRCPVKLEAQSSFDGEHYTLDHCNERATEINDTIMKDAFWSGNQVGYICDMEDEGRTIEAVLEDVRFGVVYENGQISGVAYIRSSRELTKKEEAHIIDGITGQFSDGWGESFEQTEIHGASPYHDYYCCFWDPSDDWKLVKV